MIFFRYTRFLESQVVELQQELREVRAQYHEIVQLKLSQSQIPSLNSPIRLEKKHTITKTETQASCSCGWITHSNSPEELQNAISVHYRSGAATRTRKRWPQLIQGLETQSEEEKINA